MRLKRLLPSVKRGTAGRPNYCRPLAKESYLHKHQTTHASHALQYVDQSADYDHLRLYLLSATLVDKRLARCCCQSSCSVKYTAAVIAATPPYDCDFSLLMVILTQKPGLRQVDQSPY